MPTPPRSIDSGEPLTAKLSCGPPDTDDVSAVAQAVRLRQSTPGSRLTQSPEPEDAIIPQQDPNNNLYRGLLEKLTDVAMGTVIRMSRKDTSITVDSFANDGRGRGWELGLDQLTRVKMIGAAGELFVG